MRKLILTFALASTALASPALARDKSGYVGIEGGAILVEDTHFNVRDLTGAAPVVTNDGVILNYKTGLDGDIIAGYDFGAVRVEAEIGYKRAKTGDISVATSLTGLTQNVFSTDGHVSSLSAMGNVLLDFGNDSGWSGYVGGGAGAARIKYGFSAATAGESVSDSQSKFAWQAIAGVRKSLSNNLDLGIKYRYFNVRKLRFSDGVGTDINGSFRSSSLLASLIFNFAPPAPPPLPPVVEAPPPPPPPATQTCPDGSVILATDACPAPPPPPPPPPPPAKGERG